MNAKVIIYSYICGMFDTKTDCYFIVNPRAGSGKTMCEWLPAERKLERMGVPFVTALTDHKRHATALAAEAAANGYRRIFAVGGDGSLHEVFNGICEWCAANSVPTEKFYLGVVPIGSGNDWIKSFGVPNDVSDVVELIDKGTYTKMDVMSVRCSGDKLCYMANIGGTGIDSHVCQIVNSQKESGKRGNLIYLNALKTILLNLKAIDVCIVADGTVVFSGPCYSIALGNGKYSGSGMRQVPLALPDDGLLDYTIIPKLGLSRILREVPRLYKGDLSECKYILGGKCRSLQIMPMNEDSADVIELDGEIEGCLPATIEVSGKSINVLTGLSAD